VKCPFCATPCRTALDLAKHCTEKHSPVKESHGELHPATEGSQRQNNSPVKESHGDLHPAIEGSQR
jgi:hypothetical protein